MFPVTEPTEPDRSFRNRPRPPTGGAGSAPTAEDESIDEVMSEVEDGTDSGSSSQSVAQSFPHHPLFCFRRCLLLLQEISGDIAEAYKGHHIVNDFLFPGSSKTAYGNKISQ